ncbi:transmembrane protein 45B-like [Artemia franciscana]
MGTLLGHVLPGTFFIGFSFWWTWAIFQRYTLWHKKKQTKHSMCYRNSASYHCFFFQNLPIEGIVKLMAITIGILGETITGFENGQFVHYGNAQHITMFFFFGLNGIVDIIMFYTNFLPKKLDYLTASLGFAVEAFLFANHLHGRSSMDKQVHYYLNYAVMACAISTLAEMRYQKSIIPSICRVLFTMVQGFWFYTVGFILYPPNGWAPWNQEDHDQMMNITTLYCWHYILAIICVIIIGSISSFFAQECGLKEDNLLLVEYGRVNNEESSSDDEGRTSLRK